MKQFLLTSLIILVALTIAPQQVQAQDTVSRRNSFLLSPVALVAGNYSKIRVRIQHGFKEHIAIGFDFKYFFPKEYPGYQLMPFVKYYFGQSTSEGFYVYANGTYGKNQGQPPKKSEYYPCYGGGAGIGILIPLGDARRWVIEFTGGAKYVVTESALEPGSVPDAYNDYFIIGPGSFFEGTIAFGYNF